MSEASDQRPVDSNDDRDVERALVESLKALDRNGRLAVLKFSRGLQQEEERPNRGAIRLLDEWMADESGYAEETWPELKEALDRDRLGYRKLFE